MAEPFSYALLRAVPDLERGEQVNVGLVLFCRRGGFLGLALRERDDALACLAPALDRAAVDAHLATLADVAAGRGPHPVGALEASERFGWLVAPASTVVQPGPVHTGLCEDPAATLAALADRLVEGRRHP